MTVAKVRAADFNAVVHHRDDLKDQIAEIMEEEVVVRCDVVVMPQCDAIIHMAVEISDEGMIIMDRYNHHRALAPDLTIIISVSVIRIVGDSHCRTNMTTMGHNREAADFEGVLQVAVDFVKVALEEIIAIMIVDKADRDSIEGALTHLEGAQNRISIEEGKFSVILSRF